MTPASLAKLSTCHPLLQDLIKAVDAFWPVEVLQGQRTEEEHLQQVAAGTSHTNHSKHVNTPALAVDVGPSPIQWPDDPSIKDDPSLPPTERQARERERHIRWQRWHVFGGFVLGMAASMGHAKDIRWGGDWDSDKDFRDQTFNDLPHFEVIS